MKKVKVVLLIGLIVIGAVYAGTRPEDMTREQKNKMIVEVAIGAFNEGDFELMAKLYSPRFVQHGPGKAEPVKWEDHELSCRVARRMLPTARHIIEDIVAEGDKVAVRLKTVVTFKEIARFGMRGSQLAKDMQNKVEFTEMDLFRIEGGKIIEEWCEYDTANVSAKMHKLRNVKTWQ